MFDIYIYISLHIIHLVGFLFFLFFSFMSLCCVFVGLDQGFMIKFLLYGFGNCDWESCVEVEVEVEVGWGFACQRMEGGGFLGWGSHHLFKRERVCVCLCVCLCL